ncbi:hypothetical protein ACQV5M_19025, partial [Leptospira sp. SA-E8]|uniref:hypothetical protein n=1 Tax=Leptospira sp. SA-E8 TaxID=3422259 RepID=UPI003EB7E627
VAASAGNAGSPVLTVGAVWLWNTALGSEGDDATSACGAVGAADRACDAESEFTLGDAWNNHLENARICAANRIQHQRLIDYIKRGQGPRKDHD